MRIFIIKNTLLLADTIICIKETPLTLPPRRVLSDKGNLKKLLTKIAQQDFG